MKILVFADVHGDFEKLSGLLERIDKKTIEETDLVICPGDFTDMFSVPTEFSQTDIADMVLQRLMALNRPMLCIPGNHDPYEILEIFKEYETNLHNEVKKRNGITFIGWGGAPTPFDTIFEPSEEETGEALAKLGQDIGKDADKNKNFILVVHNPPKDTNTDLTQTGEHVGSAAIRDFITEKQPLLTISAHIHEAEGIDKLGRTTLFNPGPVFRGNYGIIEIKDNIVKCRIEKKRVKNQKKSKA